MLILALLGCVTKGTYELAEVQLDATRLALQSSTASCHEEALLREEELAAAKAEVLRLNQEVVLRDEQIGSLEQELDEYRREHAAHHEHDVVPPPEVGPAAPPPTVDEMADGLAELSRKRMETERRIAEYQELERRLAPLVADGRLTLHHEQGRLMLRIPTDPMFTDDGPLSPYGDDLVTRLNAALKDLPRRRWVVSGHTDDVPHHSAQYQSNWELAFDRAVTVVRALQDAGFTAPISASSFAGSLPIADNGTPEGRRTNRRLEIVLVPDLSTLPGSDTIEALEKESP